MKTQQTKHEESGCTDYLQHNAESCPVMAAARKLNRGETLNQFADRIIADDKPSKAQPDTARHSPDHYAITNITADNEREQHLIAEIRGLRYHADKLSEALRDVMASREAGDSRLAASTFYIVRQALADYDRSAQ